MRYLVVIPARGGSKGIPFKNIVDLCGKPLINYTLDTISNIEFDGDVVVSTDSDLIKNKIMFYKNIMIIDRPPEISTDESSTESALIHAIEYMKMQGKLYDAVITLQTTSPFRSKETIINCINKYEDVCSINDALLTLNESYQDYWFLKDDKFSRLFPNNPRRRQDRNPIFVENGLVYITSVKSLLKTNSVLGTNCAAFVTDVKESIDINEPIDLIIAEYLMKERNYVKNSF